MSSELWISWLRVRQKLFVTTVINVEFGLFVNKAVWYRSLRQNFPIFKGQIFLVPCCMIRGVIRGRKACSCVTRTCDVSVVATKVELTRSSRMRKRVKSQKHDTSSLVAYPPYLEIKEWRWNVALGKAYNLRVSGSRYVFIEAAANYDQLPVRLESCSLLQACPIAHLRRWSQVDEIRLTHANACFGAEGQALTSHPLPI